MASGWLPLSLGVVVVLIRCLPLALAEVRYRRRMERWRRSQFRPGEDLREAYYWEIDWRPKDAADHAVRGYQVDWPAD